MKIIERLCRRVTTYKRKNGDEVKQIVLPKKITPKVSDFYFLNDRKEFNEIHIVIKYKK